MRLNLTLSPNSEPVPFNHLHQLTGALHKWLGAGNDVHDGVSLYAFGWLNGGAARDGALGFPDGARWRLSFFDRDVADRVADGILRDPAIAYGLSVTEVKAQATPDFGTHMHFKVDGPVVTRQQRDDGTRQYLTFDDPDADDTMTRTLQSKLRTAGLDGDHLRVRVRFDRGYDGARTKLSRIKGVDHKGSICPVIVEGTPDAVRFAWNVGVGELTGSGFGALQ